MVPPKSFFLAILAALAFAAPANASTITGLTKSNQLFTFDSASPGTVSANTAVTGLNAGDTLVALDRNPADGMLYGLGAQSRFYRITDAGAATQVGPVFPTLLAGTGFDLDFNSFGTARVVSDMDQNFTLSADGTQTVQTALAFATGDSNFGNNPSVVALAYTNNVAQGDSQTVIGYHFSSDKLVTLGGNSENPSTGKLHTVGNSAATAQDATALGLDAAPDGTVFALSRTAGSTKLFTVNAATGQFTSVGDIGNGGNTTADIATDAVTNQFSFSAASYNYSESAGTVTVTVKRSSSLGNANVSILTSDASAKAGEDFVKSTDFASFTPGVSERTLNLRILPDALDEGDETFTIALQQPTGGNASTAAPSTTVIEIADNDTGPVPSTPVTALTAANELVTFDSAAPGTVSAPLPITGLPAGDELLGIDRRPATGGLYGVSKQSRVFRIDESSGAATQIGDVLTPPLANSSSVGLDFSPVADRLRITSTGGSGQQLRVNPDDGSVVTDSPLIFVAGDPFAGATPSIVGIAYSGNVPGSTSTTLYAYDYTHDNLTRIGSPGGSPASPNSGATFTLGSTLMKAIGAGDVGFDIDAEGHGWLLSRDSAANQKTRLHLVDLTTGEGGNVGDVGAPGIAYRDLALPAVSQSIQLGGASFEGSEAAGAANVTVVRSQTRGAASVQLTTGDGSAAGGSDYSPVNTTVAFADGEQSKTVAIPVTNDTAVEGPETLTVAVSDPRGGVASLGSATSATVTISSDDRAGGPVGDTTKPKVKLCGATKQDLAKQKAVVLCFTPDEAGTAAVTGKLTIAGVKKPITLKAPKAAKLTANKKATVKVTLSKKQIAQVKSALKKRKKVTAAIAIKVTDAAGNATTVNRKVTGATAKKKK